MYSNQKFAIDFLISIFLIFILTTTILSISTSNWYINTKTHRLGLFQQCTIPCCCQTKELNRIVTILTLFSLILLSISTISSFLLMGTRIDKRNRTYILIPIALFGAGIAMTMSFMRIYERISINGSSALIFLIDTVLTFVIGGVSILHGSIFYF